jgi:hypothetical protein
MNYELSVPPGVNMDRGKDRVRIKQPKRYSFLTAAFCFREKEMFRVRQFLCKMAVSARAADSSEARTMHWIHLLVAVGGVLWLSRSGTTTGVLGQLQEQVLCHDNLFGCYGKALKYTIGIYDYGEFEYTCDFSKFSTVAKGGNIPNKSLIKISIDWRDDPAVARYVDAANRAANFVSSQSGDRDATFAAATNLSTSFRYETVVLNVTSGVVESNVLQVRTCSVNESQAASSYFSYDELTPRIDFFHVYQSPGEYRPSFLVERMDDEGKWETVVTSCLCQQPGQNTSSCNVREKCYVDPVFVRKDGSCSLSSSALQPPMANVAANGFLLLLVTLYVMFV